MRIGHIDRILLISAVVIALLGIVFVYSATWDLESTSPDFSAIFLKQCMWVLVGLILLLVIANIDYLKILNFAFFLYILNLAALIFLLIFGGERYGAKRWIDLGLVSIQPSEFIKLTAVLALAAFIGERREKIGSFGNFLGGVAIISPAIILIFLQPDLGTAIIFLPILFAVLFICGERLKFMVFSLLAGLISIPFLWSMLKDYQKNRLLVFLNPNLDPLGAGYTIIQSKIAIGSGGLFGKGWLNGTQSYLKFLPERHTDFIFSVIGEEWGFLGSLILIALYLVVIMRGIRIMQNSDDIYGRAISAGIVSLMAFQILINLSMTVGLMPVVGLPLPFISYGGSSALVFLVSIGFLLSISRRAH